MFHLSQFTEKKLESLFRPNLTRLELDKLIILLQVMNQSGMTHIIWLIRYDSFRNLDGKFDAFVNCAGAVPDTDFLLNSGVATNKDGFVVTNNNFETNKANVYAVGDISCADGVNNQHWAYAQETGKFAARSILGIESLPKVRQVWLIYR